MQLVEASSGRFHCGAIRALSPTSTSIPIPSPYATHARTHTDTITLETVKEKGNASKEEKSVLVISETNTFFYELPFLELTLGAYDEYRKILTESRQLLKCKSPFSSSLETLINAIIVIQLVTMEKNKVKYVTP